MALGYKKGQLMTILVFVLFILMLAELLTFVIMSITYNQLSQQNYLSSGSRNYGNELNASAASFAKASLSAAIKTLAAYEYNPSLRKDNFVSNASLYLTDLIRNGTLPDSAGAYTMNVLNSSMAGYTFANYNKTVSSLLGITAINATANETNVHVYQSSPYYLSLNYIENIVVNSTAGTYHYSIPVNVSVSLNGTPDLFYAQQGIMKNIHFSPLDNITSVIGNAYATSGNSIGFIYGTVYKLPSGLPCTSLSSNIVPSQLQSAPLNKTLILVTSDASGLTSSCENNYGGIIAYAVNSVLPTVPFLVYPSSSGIVSDLYTGEQVLLYGPGFDTLNISNLQNAVSNGYYFASPFTPSYLDRASASFLTHSPNGIFTLSNYNRKVGVFNGAATVSVSSSSWQSQTTYITISAWVNFASLPSTNMRLINDLSNSGQTTYAGFNFDWTGTQIRLEIGNGATDDQLGWTPSPALAAGAWYNIVEVSSPLGMSIYINGKLVASNSDILKSTFVSGQPFYIASWNNGGYFSGAIADVQIYNTTLSSSEIQTIYQEGISALPIANAGLVGWWPLNGNANDYSGFGNNGTAASVTYSLPANYTRDSILLTTTSQTSPIPGVLNSNNNGMSSNTLLPHLYLSNMPLEFNNGKMQTANFNPASSHITMTVPQVNTAAGGFNTVSFWMDWSGAAPEMPFMFDTSYDLWIASSSCFGFNTEHSDNYGGALPSNLWTFVTAVFYNGAYTGNSLLYINGAPETLTQCAGSAQSGTASTSDQISYVPTSGTYMSAKIANVQIYNISLSSTQIKTLYQEGIPGGPVTTNSLAGWWPLNGNANDYSGNGNNGTAYSISYVPFSSSSTSPGLSTVTGVADEWGALGLSG